MTELKCKTILIGCALGLGAAVVGAATSVPAPAAMTKQGYQAARARIGAQYKAEAAACGRLRGNARDLCKLQAKGRSEVAQAQLEAQYHPSPEADRKAMDAKADADFRLAKANCRNLKGDASRACIEQAKVMRDAAHRLAVVQKVEKLHALKDDKNRAPRQETPAHRFAAQKAFCQIQGTDRDRCMLELKRRYGKA